MARRRFARRSQQVYLEILSFPRNIVFSARAEIARHINKETFIMCFVHLS